jgi:molecular chaperone DnaK (HSP70)
MAHVIADLSFTGTADVAVTTLSAEFPGFRGDIRLTRSELDDEIRQPLAAFIDVLRELLVGNRIHLADLTAVATVGGAVGHASRAGLVGNRRCP